MRSDHHLHAFCDIHDLQRNQSTATSEQPPAMGRKPEDLASSTAPYHRIHHARCNDLGLLLILEGRTPKSREDRSLLLRLRRRLLHL